MQVPLRNMQGQTIGQVELRDDVFGLPIDDSKKALMHQAYIRQLANARLGTHNTLTRSDVAGGGKKIWRQKGTGRARQGSIRAPHWRHGGVVFGPHPRSYAKRMPRKMRRLALRSALSAKAAGGQIIVLDELKMDEPRTKTLLNILHGLGLESSVLILLPQRDEALERSSRNLSGVRTLRANYLNIRDILGHDYLIIPQSSLDLVESILG